MASRTSFYLLIGLLMITGISYTIYRHTIDKIPLLPTTKSTIWTVEASIKFNGHGAVEASLALPQDPNFSVLSESAASNGYGLNILEEDHQRRAIWSQRNAQGNQELFYTANFKALSPTQPQERAPEPVPHIDWRTQLAPAAQAIIDAAWEKSASNLTYARQLLQLLQQRDQQNIALLRSHYYDADLFVLLLNSKGVPATKVMALALEDGRRRQQLQDWVEVYDQRQQHWVLFNPRTGAEGQPDDLLLWQRNGLSVLDLRGGSQSKVSFSIIKETRPALATAIDMMAENALSLYKLPLEEQALLRGLFLIPIGVLVVVMLRVLIGIKTSGTFMPVLIALAFIQTKLLTGLVGFLLIVACGLLIRGYLSRLNLLLISRISAVVIVVLGIIAGFTLLAYNLGLTEGLTITFFPMIILAWTIERMSILWEEEGAQQVFIQGGGSLLVAVLTYLAMDNDLVRHWAYNFLGIHLVILALILLMGQYTGYRLLELRRFAPLAKDN